MKLIIGRNRFQYLKWRWVPAFLIGFSSMVSCSVSRTAYDPERKYAPEKLQEDYRLFRNVLEESHPSLYWFTPKDSIDQYFDQGYKTLTDSMTERSFRTMMTYVITKIRCGHTSLRYSSKYSKYLDTAKLKVFPLRMKFWGDTAVVTGTLLPKEPLIKRGTIITAINGYPITQLRDTIFQYLTGDGFSVAGKYQSLSNLGNFGVSYKNLFGLPDTFRIQYVDSLGYTKDLTVPVFDPNKDSLLRFRGFREIQTTRRERRAREKFSIRSLQVDTSLSSGYMTLNSFTRGSGMKKFFRRSFRSIRKLGLENLVIDVRGNGGGDAGNSTLLTQYLSNKPFKIADSLYAIKRSSQYRDYIKWQSVYWFMMKTVTRKHSDGKYHFGYFERHFFKPKKKNHFDGNVYILIGGNSFSATTLFAQALKGQENVQIIGEETGGGAYGNTAWMIPEARLPNTGIRLRIPKFRLVMDKRLVSEGRGVMPDITVSPTAEDIRMGIDVKVEAVRKIIENNRKRRKVKG